MDTNLSPLTAALLDVSRHRDAWRLVMDHPKDIRTLGDLLSWCRDWRSYGNDLDNKDEVEERLLQDVPHFGAFLHFMRHRYGERSIESLTQRQIDEMNAREGKDISNATIEQVVNAIRLALRTETEIHVDPKVVIWADDIEKMRTLRLEGKTTKHRFVGTILQRKTDNPKRYKAAEELLEKRTTLKF